MKNILSLVSVFNTVSVANSKLTEVNKLLKGNKGAVKNCKRAIGNCDDALKAHDENQKRSPDMDLHLDRNNIVTERSSYVGRLAECKEQRKSLKLQRDACRNNLRNALKQARKSAGKPALRAIKKALAAL